MKSLVACYWWYTCTWHMMSHMSHWWCVIVIITHVICLGNVTPRPMSLVSSQIRSGTRMNVVMIAVILSVQGTVSEWLIVLMTSPTANCRWQEVNITTGERVRQCTETTQRPATKPIIKIRLVEITNYLSNRSNGEGSWFLFSLLFLIVLLHAEFYIWLFYWLDDASHQVF